MWWGPTQVPSDFFTSAAAHPMGSLPEPASQTNLGGGAGPSPPVLAHPLPPVPGLPLLGRPDSPAAAEGRMKKYRRVRVLKRTLVRMSKPTHAARVCLSAWTPMLYTCASHQTCTYVHLARMAAKACRSQRAWAHEARCLANASAGRVVALMSVVLLCAMAGAGAAPAATRAACPPASVQTATGHSSTPWTMRTYDSNVWRQPRHTSQLLSVIIHILPRSNALRQYTSHFGAVHT